MKKCNSKFNFNVFLGILVYLAALRIINGDYEIDATVLLMNMTMQNNMNINMQNIMD